jgi:hypothetical protein
MRSPVYSFIFQVIGAFLVWTFKGYKGKFDDEMTGPYNSSNKSIRNIIISGIFLFLVYLIISNVIENKKKEPESIHFEYKISR